MLVPQKVYAGNNAPFKRKATVIFPGGINLRYASEQRLSSHPEYQARPTTSNPDRLKFTLRIEVCVSILPVNVSRSLLNIT